MKKSRVAVLVGLLCLFATTAAHAVFVDFESEASGAKANGYTVNGVTFTDTVGSGLNVDNFGAQGNGQSLAVFTDGDGSGLQMTFGGVYSKLKLDFGNDDPAWTNAGDLALLRAFLGVNQVGQVTVVLNRDDIMNQTIGISGVSFDNAFFAYVDPQLQPFTGTDPIGLIEIVDNIAVPEPGLLSLLGIALAGFGLARRRRA